MKPRHPLLSATLAALLGVALLAPTVASAAPYHHRGHKVCHWDRHHHRVCHWVR